MAKVITSIALVDEGTETERDGALQYGEDPRMVKQAMTPQEIVDALLQLDPDDLVDIARVLRERVFGD